MGRPIRQQESDAIYLVSNRCLEARFFFRPGPEVNKIILGVLAYTADKYDIEIFAFVFMSNHFHLVVRADALNLHHFMRDLQAQVARRLNKHWGRSPNGRGKFFGRRYQPTKLLDDEVVLEKLCYTLCNPCLSNLVRHPKLWPGLSSWDIHASGRPLIGERIDSQEYWRLRRKHSEWSDEKVRRRATTEYALEMAKLPMWEDLDDDEYDQKVCEVVEDYASHVADERRVPCLGAQKVCAQHFNDRPREPKISPPPLCLASDPKRRDEHVEQHRETTDRYHEAVGELRQGRADVTFPHGTIPPHRVCCVGAPRPRDALSVA